MYNLPDNIKRDKKLFALPLHWIRESNPESFSFQNCSLSISTTYLTDVYYSYLTEACYKHFGCFVIMVLCFYFWYLCIGVFLFCFVFFVFFFCFVLFCFFN